MGRLFQHLMLDRATCNGLRETVRPYMRALTLSGTAVDFCTRVYEAFYVLEEDTDKQTVDFPVDLDDVLLINNYVSPEEGEWAKSLLHQTRQALHELRTGKHAVRLAPQDATDKLLEGISFDLDEPPALA